MADLLDAGIRPFGELEVDDRRAIRAPLPADPNLLTIVFQNLLINAAQAMHGRGA